MNNSISEKITTLRPLLIFLIITTHIQGSLYRPDTKDIGFTIENFLHALLSGTISVSALPLLSIISGYLAGKSYKKYSHKTIVANKVYRLLLPMVFWNLILCILIYYSQKQGLPRRPDLELYPLNLKYWLYGLLSIVELPANQPLYFLKELFLCFLILPILHNISKNKLATLIFLFIVAYMSINNINMNQFFHRIDIYGFFLIGLFINTNKINIDTKKSKARNKLVLTYFTLTVLATLYAFNKENSYFVYLIKFMTVLGPFAFWLGADYIKGQLKNFLMWLSPASFPAFLGHILILNLYWDAWSEYFKATPFTQNYWFFWLSSMILCFLVMGIIANIYRTALKNIKKYWQGENLRCL